MLIAYYHLIPTTDFVITCIIGPTKRTPLHSSCSQGSLKCATRLLEHGVNPNMQSLSILNFTFVLCAMKMLSSRVGVLDNEGDTPLHRACFRGRVNCVKLLLEHKADATLQSTPSAFYL